jgi:hypothetical protein
MDERLLSAVRLAESVRYPGDRGRDLERGEQLESSRIHYHFNQAGLRLSRELTPGTYRVLEKVCIRLKIEPDYVLAYVHASPEIQARCYSADTSDCLVSLTSGLVQLMREDELAFVLGHELGHFLLGHGVHESNDDLSTEKLIQQRSREISADRVGMLACSSKEAALRALMKTTAGLDDSFLRFDIGSYLGQMSSSPDEVRFLDDGSTHPSLVMRCRALLWFSMSSECAQLVGGSGAEDLARIDQRLGQDLQKFVDGPARKRISDASDSFRLWTMLLAATRNGSFSKGEQEMVANSFGDEMLEKILGLFSGCGKEEVKSLVRERLLEAGQFYQFVAPAEFSIEEGAVKRKIGQQFSQSDFLDYAESVKLQIQPDTLSS